jgi:Tfp pilus assembly protein PilN
MKKKQQNINLLRHQEKAALDKFLDWAFTVGRPIIIFVQAIALSAFAYRFILDRQIIDLHDKIKQEQTIVTLSKNNEEKFRSLQTRLNIIKTLDAMSNKKTSLLQSILKISDGKISFQSMIITKTSISLNGIVPSIGQLTRFVQELRTLPEILTVSVNTIQNNTSTGTISVSITATLKETI